MKKANKKLIPACVLATSILVGNVSMASASTFSTTDPLKVREGASIDSKKVGLLQYDSTVETNSIKDGWAKISFKGKDAFVSANYLHIKDVDNYDFTVNGNGVRIRTLPNLATGKVIGAVDKGYKLEVIEQDDNGWYKVKYNNQIGFITNQFVTVNQKGGSEAKPEV
ncbi:SH3 domain-containing protein, partial [Bacillus sp. JJ864]|uniref:SH3 domain-containing protein n=1 Tax=Bacillus sp. JJ864 TaxID=3122975 RepID=UPI00300070FA